MTCYLKNRKNATYLKESEIYFLISKTPLYLKLNSVVSKSSSDPFQFKRFNFLHFLSQVLKDEKQNKYSRVLIVLP